jgi:formate dehydrogenase subunit gamma
VTGPAQRTVEICARFALAEGPLLLILHEIQAEFGCIDAEAERIVAETLNLSRAEVHGVVSFYHDFSSTEDLRPCVEICRAEACQARGIEAILPAAEEAAGDRVRLHKVFCLGMCSVGPSARVGDTVHARLDEAALVALVLAQ